MQLKNEIASDLLKIKAIQIRTKMEEYFIWTSGIKSPIYCDNRLTMSYPGIRSKITMAFMEMIADLDLQPDVIAGCATAGIPHAAWLAQSMNLPMAYVRSKPKGHGKGNQIEGNINKGDKVLVIEDLISTGGSSLDTAKVLEEAGAEVIHVLAIFTYGLNKSQSAFDDAKIHLSTITGFDHLLTMLQEDKQITKEESEKLLYWRNQL